jgi:beta-glucosidase
VNISFDLKNTGSRNGEEVAQLYVRYLDSKVVRPLKELKGFQRVAVNAGQTKRVMLTLQANQLAYWNTDEHRFVVEPGKIEVMIGSSSADVRLSKTINVAR